MVHLPPRGTPNHDPSLCLQCVETATDIAFIPRHSPHEVFMAAQDHAFRALRIHRQPPQDALLQSR